MPLEGNKTTTFLEDCQGDGSATGGTCDLDMAKAPLPLEEVATLAPLEGIEVTELQGGVCVPSPLEKGAVAAGSN